MKKFSVLIALALLAVAGTGYAVTCAYDNVPAATLLVPHFRVGRNGSTGGDITGTGVDTLCAVTNVSGTGIIVHVTVWNKYSKAVLDFNVPMTAYDVAFFSMKQILNGDLNVNKNLQKASSLPNDPCGLNQTSGTYAPTVGFGATRYVRFTNPDAADRRISISIYSTPAYTGSFRQRVWDSLDETQDISSMTSPASPGILDADNPACGYPSASSDGVFSGDFGGYLTLDVVNFCTNYFPDQAAFYVNDAIATTGWSAYGYTPNAIIGDVFYLDGNPNGGNVSGDPMVALEFDSRLDWNTMNTFFGRYAVANFEPSFASVGYAFAGDGREPLGSHYGFRYLSDAAAQMQSWAIVWRSDNYDSATGYQFNLCDWLANDGPFGEGMYDSVHQIGAYVYDNDEASAVVSGGPSGGPPPSNQYIFLETQRISLLNNGDLNPGGFKSGWIDLTLPGYTGAFASDPKGLGVKTYQAYVGIQHTGPGLAISVGHSASLIGGNANQFQCSPALTALGTGNVY